MAGAKLRSVTTRSRWFQCVAAPRETTQFSPCDETSLLLLGSERNDVDGVYVARAQGGYRHSQGSASLLFQEGSWHLEESGHWLCTVPGKPLEPPEAGWKHGERRLQLRRLELRRIPKALRDPCGLRQHVLTVRGAGCSDFDGAYRVVGWREGRARFRKDGCQRALVHHKHWWRFVELNEDGDLFFDGTGPWSARYAQYCLKPSCFPDVADAWVSCSGSLPTPKVTTATKAVVANTDQLQELPTEDSKQSALQPVQGPWIQDGTSPVAAGQEVGTEAAEGVNLHCSTADCTVSFHEDSKKSVFSDEMTCSGSLPRSETVATTCGENSVPEQNLGCSMSGPDAEITAPLQPDSCRALPVEQVESDPAGGKASGMDSLDAFSEVAAAPRRFGSKPNPGYVSARVKEHQGFIGLVKPKAVQPK